MDWEHYALPIATAVSLWLISVIGFAFWVRWFTGWVRDEMRRQSAEAVAQVRGLEPVGEIFIEQRFAELRVEIRELKTWLVTLEKDLARLHEESHTEPPATAP